MVKNDQKIAWQKEAINMELHRGIMSLDSLSAEELYTKYKMVFAIRRTLLGVSVVAITALLLILTNVLSSFSTVLTLFPLLMLGIVSCIAPVLWFSDYFRAVDIEEYVKLLSPIEISKFNGWVHDLFIRDVSAIEVTKPALWEIVIVAILLLLVDLFFII